MQSIGVITPVTEPTDWVSSMVAAHKKDKQEIRLHQSKRPQHSIEKAPSPHTQC
uniref:Uncharacterized protein n=1 Tax=Anguilla anguilla TaxID=7936 RepID=A0A0E9VWY8_ANGAN